MGELRRASLETALTLRVSAAFAALFIGIAVYGVSTVILPHTDSTFWWFTALNLVLHFTPAVAIGVRVATNPQERLTWGLLSLAFVFLTVRDAIEILSAGPWAAQPNAPISQVLYAAFALCMLSSIGLTIRARIRGQFLAVWLDGIMAALAMLAAVSYFTLAPGDEFTVEAAVQLLYFSVPFLFVAILVSPLAAMSRRPAPSWWLSVIGSLLMATATITSNRSEVEGAYRSGTPVGTLWLISGALFALVALRPSIPGQAIVRSRTAVAIPAVCSLGALTVVAAATFGANNLVPQLFAFVAIAVGIIRMLISVSYGERLGRREAQLNLSLTQARDEALAAATAKTDFLATMSHEIRTPLSAVLGMNDLLKDTELSATQRDYVDKSSASGSLLLELVSNILDFSKIDAGAVELESRRIDLARLVAASATVLSFAAESKNISLITDFSDECPRFVTGDASRLRQVLVNLLANAVKFTATGDVRLSVSPGAEVGSIRFMVADTGIGIAPEKIVSLFEPFTQADQSTTRKHGGTGLGLTISQSLVTLMGGRIDVASAPGEGSRFWFELPLAEVAGPIDPAVAGEAGPRNDGTPKRASHESLRVLIAEDNTVLQMLATLLVTKLGHHIEVVSDGAAAVDAVQKAPFDVVLMDLHMPNMGGLAATRLIRSHTALFAQPRIIALTAGETGEDRDACIAAGMDDYLSKPFTIEDLQQAFLSIERDPSEMPLGDAAPQLFGALDELGVDAKFEILRAFTETSAKDLSLLESALPGRDDADLRFLAHRMRGGSLAIGATELSAACLRLENAHPGAPVDPQLITAVQEQLKAVLRAIELTSRTQPDPLPLPEPEPEPQQA